MQTRIAAVTLRGYWSPHISTRVSTHFQTTPGPWAFLGALVLKEVDLVPSISKHSLHDYAYSWVPAKSEANL